MDRQVKEMERMAAGRITGAAEGEGRGATRGDHNRFVAEKATWDPAGTHTGSNWHIYTSRNGSKSGPDYKPDVGPDFRGPGDPL